MTNPGGGSGWQSGSITKAVQHAYVNSRVHTINTKGKGGGLLEDAIAELVKAAPDLAKASRKKHEEALAQIAARLQSAPLTINFDAWSWFNKRNDFDTYAQMYERGVSKEDGVMRLDDSDKKNPAGPRIYADDIATLPSAWADIKPDLYNPAAGKSTIKGASSLPARGLAPGGRGGHAIASKMSPGAPKAMKDEHGWDHFVATNNSFDPKTKQVFAALNYGRRPHGACTFYGHSYFVLSDKFKRDALYYAGDTFGALGAKLVKADDQLTYDLLGLALAKTRVGGANLAKDIVSSCLRGASLPDTPRDDVLFEAHLFEQLRFQGGVTQMNVSGQIKAKDARGDSIVRRATASEWMDIQTHARTFAAKHGIRIFFVE